MKNVPNLVKAHNDGKGAQLEYTLLPLAAIENVVLKVANPESRIVQSIDDAIINKCEHKFDKLLLDKQTFNDLFTLVKANADVLKKQELVEFDRMQEKIGNNESQFLEHLRETLFDIFYSKFWKMII